MKSGTPKTYFDTKYWSIKQFGKAFDELVLLLLLPTWILPHWNPQIETNLNRNDSETTRAYKTKHFL